MDKDRSINKLYSEVGVIDDLETEIRQFIEQFPGFEAFFIKKLARFQHLLETGFFENLDGKRFIEISLYTAEK